MGGETHDLRAASEWLDGVLRELDEHADPAVRERLHEVVGLLMSLHAAGLERLMALASDAALGGAALVNRIADDPLLGPLLLVHQLHPHALDVRLSRALDRLRPQVAAHGCRAALVAVEGETARVRLEGGARLADGADLVQTMETMLLEAAPELRTVAIERTDALPAPAAPLIQITRRTGESIPLPAPR